MINSYQSYLDNSILTASSQKLTLMLYNGVIKYCNQAKIAIQDNNIKEANTLLIKAQQITSELKHSLNMNIELSKDMYRLYDYAEECLVDANISKTVEPIDIALDIFREFKEVWQQIV